MTHLWTTFGLFVERISANEEKIRKIGEEDRRETRTVSERALVDTGDASGVDRGELSSEEASEGVETACT